MPSSAPRGSSSEVIALEVIAWNGRPQRASATHPDAEAGYQTKSSTRGVSG